MRGISKVSSSKLDKPKPLDRAALLLELTISDFVRLLQCASRYGEELCIHANKDHVGHIVTILVLCLLKSKLMDSSGSWQ
jgi:hypothetical protein